MAHYLVEYRGHFGSGTATFGPYKGRATAESVAARLRREPSKYRDIRVIERK